MAKSSISKTLGPIHFEDLDPRRFEDLVRELAYDFRDWQSIEATGRGGSDDGFDIRAYERTDARTSENEDEDADREPPHPMEGRVWMIQCKREKEIGPKRVGSIVTEGINPTEPPYGFILAAPANFTKASHDTFREELRKYGVMEFYLWGRAALEDMLHLPKNDHILFTFFGISLISRRRSRGTEIRSIVSTKNKLYKLLGEQPRHQPVLLRDTKDVHYPFKTKYSDFKTRPRWREYPAVEMHPLGLIVRSHEYFAYRNPQKKEWDFTDSLNLVHRLENDDDRDAYHELKQNIESFWESLQKSHQAKLIRNSLIRYDSIVVIDSEGDSSHKFPHVYVDFKNGSPFWGSIGYLEISEHHHESIDDLKRIKRFPNTFTKPQVGTIYRDRTIALDEKTRAALKHGSRYMHCLYDCDQRFSFLNAGDVIGVENAKDSTGNGTFIKITHRRQESGKQFLSRRSEDPTTVLAVESQIGRGLKPEDAIDILEFKSVYEWELEEKKP